MRRSFSVQKKSGGMQSDDGQRLYGEAAERRRADERREAESALMESLGRRPDRRVFKLSKKKKKERRDGKTSLPASRLPQSERSCLFGHSEFNLCSVGSCDFVRL